MKTMKKTYLNPELIVVKIQPAHMLAASEKYDTNDDFGGGSGGTSGGDFVVNGRDGDFDED